MLKNVLSIFFLNALFKMLLLNAFISFLRRLYTLYLYKYELNRTLSCRNRQELVVSHATCHIDVDVRISNLKIRISKFEFHDMSHDMLHDKSC